MHSNGASITSDVIINSEPWNTWVHFITLRLQIYERGVQWVPGSRDAGLALVVPAIWPFLQAQRAVCLAMVRRGWLLSLSSVTISHVPAASWPGNDIAPQESRALNSLLRLFRLLGLMPDNNVSRELLCESVHREKENCEHNLEEAHRDENRESGAIRTATLADGSRLLAALQRYHNLVPQVQERQEEEEEEEARVNKEKEKAADRRSGQCPRNSEQLHPGVGRLVADRDSRAAGETHSTSALRRALTHILLAREFGIRPFHSRSSALPASRARQVRRSGLLRPSVLLGLRVKCRHASPTKMKLEKKVENGIFRVWSLALSQTEPMPITALNASYHPPSKSHAALRTPSVPSLTELMVTDRMTEGRHELIDNRQLNYHRYCQAPLADGAHHNVHTRMNVPMCVLLASVCDRRDRIPSLSPGDPGSLSLQRATGARSASLPAKGGNPVYVAPASLGRTRNTTASHRLPPHMQV
ncbi:hypothetical protein EYF80_019304 [Liparis tanakae]|uniref:Uncharacterized protein n=1 Tax=Liparis tanakae TaxID=230148 RepID=A0A4Z2HXK9_9TELE|nr:hypothetical protein EYF80_019304 [Liparis tanakae]